MGSPLQKRQTSAQKNRSLVSQLQSTTGRHAVSGKRHFTGVNQETIWFESSEHGQESPSHQSPICDPHIDSKSTLESGSIKAVIEFGQGTQAKDSKKARAVSDPHTAIRRLFRDELVGGYGRRRDILNKAAMGLGKRGVQAKNQDACDP